MAAATGNATSMASPLPQRHACDFMFHQHARELALNLASFDLIVEFGNFGQRVGRDQPDLPGTWIGDAHQIKVGFHIAGRHGAQFLVAQGNSFLRSPFWLGEGSDSSVERGAVQHGIELIGNLLAFGLAARGAHLQVLRGDAVVARLRGLKESEDGSRGSGAAEWIGR